MKPNSNDYIFDIQDLNVSALKKSLRVSGYALIRNVISNQQVAEIRNKCKQYYKPNPLEETEIEASEFVSTPELSMVPFNKSVISTLEAVFSGHVTYYPNFVLRVNRYTNWHVDNGFHPDFHDEPSHLYSDDFSNLQCMVYLQDNTPGQGGGLDVAHASHKWYDSDTAPCLSQLEINKDDIVTLDSKAGDMILFDGRAIHRGSTANDQQITPKLGIFWSASAINQNHNSRFLKYLNGRSDYLVKIGLTGEYLKYMVSRYDDVKKVQYPEFYSSTLTNFVEANNVTMASIAD